ncbi:hypothetical protein ACFPM0_22445 [Pseudonocardia sulfidoxydans]
MAGADLGLTTAVQPPPVDPVRSVRPVGPEPGALQSAARGLTHTRCVSGR